MINKTIIRNFLEKIQKSISAFIDRYDLLMTNDELIDLIIISTSSIGNSWFYDIFNELDSVIIISKIFDVKFLKKYIKNYNELCKITVKDDSNNIIYVNPKYCTIYDELCRITIKDDPHNIKYIKPEYCKNYNELCKIAVRYNPYYIKHINPEYCKIYDELCKIIVENNSYNIRYIKPKYCTIYDELKKEIK